MRWVVQELVAGRWFTVTSYDNEADAVAEASWFGACRARVLVNGKKVWPPKR